MPKRISRRKHSPKVKFQIVLETLKEGDSKIEIARKYDLNSNMITKWQKEFFTNGHLIFEQKNSVQSSDKQVEGLHRLLGKKEIEIDLLKKFLGNIGSP